MQRGIVLLPQISGSPKICERLHLQRRCKELHRACYPDPNIKTLEGFGLIAFIGLGFIGFRAWAFDPQIP